MGLLLWVGALVLTLMSEKALLVDRLTKDIGGLKTQMAMQNGDIDGEYYSTFALKSDYNLSRTSVFCQTYFFNNLSQTTA